MGSNIQSGDFVKVDRQYTAHNIVGRARQTRDGWEIVERCGVVSSVKLHWLLPATPAEYMAAN